jgi:hypothetical protein
VGPFVIDVDNEHADLVDALTVTRKIVNYLCRNVNENQVLLFFTGHKGFNLEICPGALGRFGSIDEEQCLEESMRKRILGELRQSGHNLKATNQASERETILDRRYCHVRLHESLNSWIENRKRVLRKKIGFTVTEFDNLTLRQMLDMSEA